MNFLFWNIVLLLHSLGVPICIVHLGYFWIWVLEFMEGVGAYFGMERSMLLS